MHVCVWLLSPVWLLFMSALFLFPSLSCFQSFSFSLSLSLTHTHTHTSPVTLSHPQSKTEYFVKLSSFCIPFICVTYSLVTFRYMQGKRYLSLSDLLCVWACQFAWMKEMKNKSNFSPCVSLCTLYECMCACLCACVWVCVCACLCVCVCVCVCVCMCVWDRLCVQHGQWNIEPPVME